jgi:hypothetical protein
MAQHHHRAARSVDQVVARFDRPAVIAVMVIEAELGEPGLEPAERFPPPDLHAVQHLDDGGPTPLPPSALDLRQPPRRDC